MTINPNTPAGTVTAAKLGALLMITPRRVQQLAAAGVIRRIARDAYPLVPSIQAYLRWLNDEARKSEQASSRGKLAETRAQEIEERIRAKMATLIPVEEHRQVIGLLLRVIRREVGKMPDAVPSYVRPAVRVEIDQMMERIAKTAADAQKAVELGEDVFRK
ncbi:MAG: hypothetical protein WBF99_01245 [Xanthobacteraceae bacterium]